MNILSVENISKSYSDKPLFENLSFGLEEGEKRAFIARNGAGKSTLMKVLSGAHAPDAGTVTLTGKPFAPSGPHDARLAGVGMI